MTDNANTFLIYEISALDGIQIDKRTAKKVILDYIAHDFLIFLHGSNNARAEIRR